MTKTAITRVQIVESKIKAFNGRVKVDEIDLASLDKKPYRATINRLEEELVRLQWMPMGGSGGVDSANQNPTSTWKQGEVGKPLFGDFSVIHKYVAALVQGETPQPFALKAGQMPKPVAKEKPAPAPKKEKPKKEPKPRKVLTPEEIADRAAANRMHITPEQRKRKTLRLSVEDALDNYIIDLVKSRRMLNQDRIKEVAAENKVQLKGRDNGHVKMNLQNVLRGKFLREEPVYIGGKEHTIEETELMEYVAHREAMREAAEEEQSED